MIHIRYPKEPWTVIELDDQYAQIYGMDCKAGDGCAFPIEEATRIAACVNACADVPDTDLTSPESLMRALESRLATKNLVKNGHQNV